MVKHFCILQITSNAHIRYALHTLTHSHFFGLFMKYYYYSCWCCCSCFVIIFLLFLSDPLRGSRFTITVLILFLTVWKITCIHKYTNKYNYGCVFLGCVSGFWVWNEHIVSNMCGALISVCMRQRVCSSMNMTLSLSSSPTNMLP